MCRRIELAVLPPEQQVTPRKYHLIAVALCALPLAACDPLGLNDGARIAAAREADGRAIGGACRHSGRALEECYGKNPKTSKAAIFAGWRDMDGYMRENNIQIVSPAGAHTPATPGNPETPANVEAPKAASAPADDDKSAAAATPVSKNAAAEEPSASGLAPAGAKRPNRVA